MQKTCEVCGGEFHIRPSEGLTRFCCSAECGYKRLTKYKFEGKSVEKVNRDGISIKQQQENYRSRVRNSVVSILGSECVLCGYDDKRALQIDHINGGGKKERREIPNTNKFYEIVINSFIAKENKYQLLCANCNVIKRIINKEHKV